MLNSMMLMPSWAILTIVLAIVVVILVAVLVLVPIGVWFRALV